MGSREPLALDLKAWIDRAHEVTAYLGRPGVTQKVPGPLLEGRLVSESDAANGNLDLYPRDELGVP